MADLLTLSELKALLNDTTVYNDAFYTAAIPTASVAISNYTDRDFASPQTTATRTYEYEGDGYLDIDDADSITAVEFVVPSGPNVALSTAQWRAEPPRSVRTPVFTYIMLPGGYYFTSPEMGFKQNWDVWAADYGWNQLPPQVAVTGVWGWPVVPSDVKLAAAWTIGEWNSRREDSGLTTEAIEGYARSWGRGMSVNDALAIPNRARDLLQTYMRMFV